MKLYLSLITAKQNLTTYQYFIWSTDNIHSLPGLPKCLTQFTFRAGNEVHQEVKWIVTTKIKTITWRSFWIWFRDHITCYLIRETTTVFGAVKMSGTLPLVSYKFKTSEWGSGPGQTHYTIFNRLSFAYWQLTAPHGDPEIDGLSLRL